MIAALIIAAVDTAPHHGSSIDWSQVWIIVRYLLSALSIITGLFFVLAGTIGVLRLPDFFTRLHAAGMTDTLGAELIILGLIIQSGWSLVSVKLFLVCLLYTSPSPRDKRQSRMPSSA